MTTVVLSTANALGDFVLCWPLLRALAEPPTLVCPAEKAALARNVLRLPAQSLHVTPWSQILQGQSGIRIEGVARVISIGSLTAACRAALERAAVGVEVIETPAPLDRDAAVEWAGRLGIPRAPAIAGNPSGPITLHIGSGGRAKRWPLDRWRALAGALGQRTVGLIAGEVEAEQWTSDERAAFFEAGGAFVEDLVELAGILRASRLVVAADCGPGHLSAALGVPTLSLFGPTDPALWAPLGPAVRVLAPPIPGPMNWLTAEAVAASVGSLHEFSGR